jgi:hypothetical protein
VCVSCSAAVDRAGPEPAPSDTGETRSLGRLRGAFSGSSVVPIRFGLLRAELMLKRGNV